MILDKGTNPEQAQFFPYLKGYVAFYAGDYKAALEQLKQANQNDPFIQCMIAQTYEKLGGAAFKDGPPDLGRPPRFVQTLSASPHPCIFGSEKFLNPEAT